MLDQPGGGGHPETSAADPKHGGCRRSPHQYRHRRLCQGRNLGGWKDDGWMARVGVESKWLDEPNLCKMKRLDELNPEIQGLNRVRTSCLVVGAHGKGSTSTSVSCMT